MRAARELLDRHGLTECESILNEWNYLRGWFDEDWKYTLKTEKSLKGASFIAATMVMSQYEPLDMLMFYDARPSAMNSMFNTDRMYECLKGYYPFYMFNQLYKEGRAVEVLREGEDIWSCAASGSEQNVMLTHYNDDDSIAEKAVKVTFKMKERSALSIICLTASAMRSSFARRYLRQMSFRLILRCRCILRTY